jgi:hypothetical protein
MKKILLIPLILCFVIVARAQFPSFTTFDGRSFYVDSSKTTQAYRKVFASTDTIDSKMAHDFAKQAESMKEKYKKLIDSIENDKILSTSQRHRKVKPLRDSVTFYEDTRIYFKSINKFTGTPKYLARVFPVTRTEYSRFFYQGSSQDDKIDLFSSFAIQSSLKKNTISSDVISGSIGIFQTTISTTFVDNSDTTNKDKLSNKVLYGGLLNAKVTLPMFYSATKHYALYIPISYKGSIDNVSVGEQSDLSKNIHFGEFAISAFLRIPIHNVDKDNTVSFYSNTKFGILNASSSFYEQLQIPNGSFEILQTSVGFEIENKIRLSFNIPVYSSSKPIKDQLASTVGIQINPKLLLSK